MPFELINARETYQIMVYKLFKETLSMNMKAYMDEMLLKLVKGNLHTTNLIETFECMRKHNIYINPIKCSCGMNSRNSWD